MVLKNTWHSSDTFPATEANTVATQVNTNTTDIVTARGVADDAQTAAATASAAAAVADGKAVAALANAATAQTTANGKYTKPGGGVPSTDMASAVVTSLGKADTAVGLVQAAKNPDLLVTGAVTVDGSDLVTSAAVVWPDGTVGTLTITSRDTNDAVLDYNITYGSPVTKTFTQPTITRNANSAATNVPAIVVS